jgi:hypothetical protein
VGLPPEAAWLFLIDPGASATRVAKVGVFQVEASVGVMACSVLADRVVTSQDFLGEAVDLAVYSLSTGKRLYYALPAHRVFNVTVSHDGRLVAEKDPACNCVRILEMPSGHQLGTLQGFEWGIFSWNGSLLANPRDVREWRDDRTVWSNVVLYPGILRPRPGSNDFLIGIGTLEPSGTRPNRNDFFDDVWLVPEHGPARLLLQHALA